MDYYSNMRADYIHREMYPDKRIDYVPKGPIEGAAYTIKPKPECVPKFTIKIEGNAVEEGARVFFEGIVDAQPKPGERIKHIASTPIFKRRPYFKETKSG